MTRSHLAVAFGRSRRHGLFALLVSTLAVGSAHAQTNPAAQALPYTQDFGTLAAASTTYPAGWQGWQVGATPSASYSTAGPTANKALIASSSAANTTDGAHNYNTKIGVLNGGTADNALALAVNTTGLAGVLVAYEVATIRNPYGDAVPSDRIGAIALQYRVGTAGAWTTVAGTEYQNNTTQQVTGTIPQNPQARSAILPAECDNQPVVQLRWAQRDVSGSGNRPGFAIDNVVVQQPPAGGQATALQLDGVNDYVTFGQAPALGQSNFTIETWFRRTGAGVVTSTGGGGSAVLGLTNVVPLVSKGRGEGDGGRIDCNYFLGIQNTPGVVLVADYEHDATSNNNHALVGTTPLANDVWYHAAVTYDGATLRLYLNGSLEAQVAAAPAPRSDLLQHAGLGTAMNSTGTVQGAFQGQLDEARIWSVARDACDIAGSMNLELTSGTGLVARWGMHDGAGSLLSNSLATPNGVLMNGTTWGTGSSFDAPAVTLDPPFGLSATAPDGVQVQLSWTDAAVGESAYQVERSTSGPGGPFTLLATLGANAGAFVDAPLVASSEYCYRVRATTACVASDFSGVACATTTAEACNALRFDPDGAGTDAYVTFGSPASLQLTALTLEMWMRRDGPGVGTSTGGGGIPDLIPLVAKGRAEAETATQDINYILGIRASDGVLAADFEEGATGGSPSLNHPVAGSTAIGTGAWHHVAATYDGTTWRLYLDGVEDAALAVGRPLGSGSTVAVALASALTSANAASGFFDGAVDEVRIWDHARTQPQIQADINAQIMTAQPGLVGRWAMNEGTGTAVYGTAGTAIHGTIVGTATSNWSRTTCAPFDLTFTPPEAPSGLTATATSFSRVDLSWTDHAANETGFEIERSTTGIGGPYSFLASVGANITTYPNTGLAPLTEYCYRVRAVNGNGASSYAGPTCATTPGAALDFGAAGATYVTFGDPAALDLAQFTLECWFRRDGAGVAISTGSGGITAVPLVTHGSPQADGSDVDMNYFLGIRSSDGVLCADFEEGPGGGGPVGLNHPVAGVTPVGNGWHHAAATYDGTTWRLYLDGNLEQALAVGQPVRSNSIQHAALATAITSTGTASGFFDGALDEVRVWSSVRTQAEIQSTANVQISAPTGGLVARWALDEGSGTAVNGSAGTAVNGTITGTGYTWAAAAPFDLSFTPPAAPSGLGATAASHSLINLTWTDHASNESGFQIERSTTGIGGTYSPLATVAANTTSYPDGGLSASTEYCYRIRAVNGNGTSGDAGPVCATTPAFSNSALGLSGSAAQPTYASFGNPAALQLSALTIEMWLRRDGAGEGTNTGTGGIADAIPLVAKGRAEAETAAADINYLFGIRASTGALCADFEEGQLGGAPSLNHPVEGATALALGTWYHVAATYDGLTWKLYLNGNLDASLPIGQPLASASTVAVALGSALTSANAPAGFFHGTLDEVRIWNVAREQAQIQATANAQLSAPTPGLVARWSLDEGSGTTIAGSAGTTANGTITGPGHAWSSPGAPFDLAFNQPPALPVLVGPADGATGVSTSPVLEVAVSDPEGAPLTVTYYGRPVAPAPGPDFTLIGLPDTQYYTSQLNGGSNAIFQSQTNWIVANRASRNIVYVGQLGDCVENGDNGGSDVEWQRADASLGILENPLTTGLPEGIPFGVSVGNHDQSPIGNPDGTTTFYNQFFGTARFTGRSYYGGHYGSNNDNWYELFSASGMDFIVISFEYDTSPDPAVLSWADGLLTTHSGRRAIVLSHFICNTGNPGGFGPQGQAIYNALRARPNLDFMLCGHVPGEGRRQDTFNGNTVHTMLSDYQGRTAGGNGWLRILEFSPANDEVRVRTYSPWLGQFENDGDSEFTLAYDMNTAPTFQVIGTVAGVPSGSTGSLAWPGLATNTAYEWYATVSDGGATVLGTTSTFTTNAGATPVATVNAISPAGVISTANPTVGVPVRISRTDATPILGFSVSFALSAELTTSPGAIAAGPFLTAVNPNVSLQVVDHGGGRYTVDGVTLGPPCGATALDEVLFTIGVGSGAAGGTGTVTIEAAHFRDCANDSLLTAPGTVGSVLIDRTAPAVALTAPDGGEFWLAGSTHDVTWTASDAAGIPADGVDLAYSTDGLAWTGFATGIANAPPYGWTLPDLVSTTVRVRVTARDAHGNAATDAGNAVFTIAGPTTTSLAVTPDPGIYQETVTLTATVAPAAAAGTVEFFEGPTSLGTAPLAGGTAAIGVTTLTVGSHVLHASYPGSAEYGGSTSATVTREVKAKIVASAGAHGSIAPSGTVLVSLDDTPSFTLTPDPGYHVSEVTVDGSPAALTSPYTFAPVNANHTIVVAFEVNPAVAPIGTLTSSQVTTGNDADGTIKLRLHWDDVLPPGSTVEVFRARFGQYPEYDDAAGQAPDVPGYPPGAPWAATAVTEPDQDDEVNHTSGYDGRDVWYHVAFVKDQYGTYSPASNLTVGRPNYLLGDVADGTLPGLGRGNNVVNGADISALGDSYGASGAAVAAVAYLDIGPTQDYSVATRPQTDNVIGFEDLVMLAINYDITAVPQVAPTARAARVGAGRAVGQASARSAPDRLTVKSPERVMVGQEFTVELSLEGGGRTQALSVGLRWEAGVAEPVRVEGGDWLARLGGVVFSPRPGTADVALLGARASGFAGQGTVAVVRFRALATGEPHVGLATLVGRDATNREVEFASSVVSHVVPRPTTTALSGAFPNPFRGSTSIAFSLADPGHVTVSVYGVDGRLVRTLANGPREPDLYRLEWDGRNEAGQIVPAGIYLVQLATARGRETRRIAFLR